MQGKQAKSNSSAGLRRRLMNVEATLTFAEQGTLVLSPSIVRANRGRLDFLTRRLPVFKRC